MVGQPRGDRLGVDRIEVAPGRRDVDQSAQWRAGRPGRHLWPPSRACRTMGISRVVSRRRGTTSRQAKVNEAETPGLAAPRTSTTIPSTAAASVRVRAPRSGAMRSPRNGPSPALLLSCSTCPKAVRSPGMPSERPPKTWPARRIARTGCRPVAGRRLAEDMQPVADLDVLDRAQVVVDLADELVEGIVVGVLRQPEVLVHLRRPLASWSPCGDAVAGSIAETLPYSSSNCSSLAMSP